MDVKTKKSDGRKVKGLGSGECRDYLSERAYLDASKILLVEIEIEEFQKVCPLGIGTLRQ